MKSTSNEKNDDPKDCDIHSVIQFLNARNVNASEIRHQITDNSG